MGWRSVHGTCTSQVGNGRPHPYSIVRFKLEQRPFAGGERLGARIQRHMAQVVAQEPQATVEYLAVCDPLTLAPLSTLHRKAVLLGALRIGKVRLLDNLLVSAPHALPLIS